MHAKHQVRMLCAVPRETAPSRRLKRKGWASWLQSIASITPDRVGTPLSGLGPNTLISCRDRPSEGHSRCAKRRFSAGNDIAFRSQTKHYCKGGTSFLDQEAPHSKIAAQPTGGARTEP
jgi:hypothetical protein